MYLSRTRRALYLRLMQSPEKKQILKLLDETLGGRLRPTDSIALGNLKLNDLAMLHRAIKATVEAARAEISPPPIRLVPPPQPEPPQDPEAQALVEQINADLYAKLKEQDIECLLRLSEEELRSLRRAVIRGVEKAERRIIHVYEQALYGENVEAMPEPEEVEEPIAPAPETIIIPSTQTVPENTPKFVYREVANDAQCLAVERAIRTSVAAGKHELAAKQRAEAMSWGTMRIDEHDRVWPIDGRKFVRKK